MDEIIAKVKKMIDIFEPKEKDIKTRIEWLCNRDYLKRDDND